MDEIQIIFDQYKEEMTGYYQSYSENWKKETLNENEFRLVDRFECGTFVLQRHWSENISNTLKLPIAVIERSGGNKTIFYAAYMYEEKVRMVLINLVDVPECRVYFKTLWDKRSLTIRGYNNVPILNTLEDIWNHMHPILKQHNRYRLYVETGLWDVVKE